MSDSDNKNDDHHDARLMMSVGHCMMQWAQVEFHLGLLFHVLLRADDPEVADLFWGRVRSFEAKLQVMHDLASHRLSNAAHLRDWNLLQGHTAALYKKRNQVAHSILINGPKGKAALEPFFVPLTPAKLILSKKDVDGYAAEFMNLAASILYFNLMTGEASQQTESPKPVPDLLSHLRIADDRKREAQRHRDLAWRLYLQQNPGLKAD